MSTATSVQRTIELMMKLMAAVDVGELPEPRHLTEGEQRSDRASLYRRDVLIERRAVRRVTTSVLAIQALEPGPDAHRYLNEKQLRRWRELIRAPRAWVLPPPGSPVEVVVRSERGFIHHEGYVTARSVRRAVISTPTAGEWTIPHGSPVPVQASGAVGYSWRPL